MVKILTLSEDDAERDGKEYRWRCPDCGILYRSDTNLEDPHCQVRFVWPDTKGYKLMMKRERYAAADAKAKDRNNKMDPRCRYVLMLATQEAENPGQVFIRGYLNEAELTLKSRGNFVMTEQGAINSIPAPQVEAKAMEMFQNGERGRALIRHLVNWINKTGGNFKVASQPAGNPGERADDSEIDWNRSY